MMDLKIHPSVWSTAAAAAASDEDVKMLLDDLDDASTAGDDATRLALSLEADASTMVMMMLLPNASGDDPAMASSVAALAATLSEEEQREQVGGDELESPDFNDDDDFDEELWTAAAAHGGSEPFDLIDADDEPFALDTSTIAHATAVHADSPMLLHHGGVTSLLTDALMPFPDATAATSAATTAAAAAKKRRGRKPSLKPKAAPKKAKRPPPSPSKARLRNYERRSRTKREHTMLSMKDLVGSLEAQITSFCSKQQRLAPEKQQQICSMALEAIALNHQNYHLRRAIDDHRFFHSMVELEYEHVRRTVECFVRSDTCACEMSQLTHPLTDCLILYRVEIATQREATPISALDDLAPPPSWTPLTEAGCFGFMRESFQEIEDFSSSEDFVSSGLEICGWSERRKLCGKSVKFLFHKHFAKDCSEDLARRSWEMRAVQDQVTRYFGPFLNVQVEVIQRITDNVVVVRRKITHLQDHWVHHTIYLLFRTKTSDGHLVCIRDMNPDDTQDMNQFVEATTDHRSGSVIWSNCFIWWKFTELAAADGASRGFDVEYGGSLSSATSADAAFWMREVLLVALRWENLVVGPLLSL